MNRRSNRDSKKIYDQIFKNSSWYINTKLKARGIHDVIAHNFFNEIKNKFEVISKSKYHIVLENDSKHNLVSEKLYDAYLGLSYPIYYGAPNINEYFDIYNNNNTNDRYTSFYKNIDKILHPFEKLYETDSDNYLLENEPIFRDMDCILDSFGNMDTTGINNDDDITDNLKFFIQRYITGLQKRELLIGEGKQKRYITKNQLCLDS